MYINVKRSRVEFYRVRHEPDEDIAGVTGHSGTKNLSAANRKAVSIHATTPVILYVYQ
jgi:hypothetical protein